MACDTFEVLVGAEQFEASRDARLGDDTVDRAAHGDASAPKPAIETSGRDMPVDVKREKRKPKEQIPRPHEVTIGAKALQHLG
jgi:hypothetical protein